MREALLLLLFLSSLASGQSGPIPATYFGLHENEIEAGHPFPTVSFGTFRVWDTDTCQWSATWTGPGAYNFTCLDDIVNKMSAHGITDIIYTFGYTPLWATNNQGNTLGGGQYGSCYPPLVSGNTANYDSTTMKAFITTIATRYDGAHGHGRIGHYETWNEPGSQFWCGTLAQLVAVQNDVYTTVKAIDATIQVHTPVMGISGSANDCNNSSGGPGWPLGAFMTANGTSNFDIVDVHLYPYPTSTFPEVGNSTMISNALCGMAHFGISGKPLWDSESSWYPSSTNQVAYVARHQLYLWSRGVVRTYWYSYDSTNLGDLFNGSTLTTTGVAFQQVYNWMVGSTMTTACSASGTVWTCGLTESNGKTARAVWNTAANSSYGITAGQWADYLDLAGGTSSIGATATSVNIGIQPILLETGTTSSPPAPPTNLTATPY